MSSIPIIYTGANSARFDFKSMGQNIRDSYRRIKEDSINRQRYNDIQAQNERKQLLSEIDVDRLSFGNEQVQSLETQLYDDFLNKTTTLVNEKIKSDGRLSTQDYLEVRTMANKYERDMQKYKASEERRLQDYAIATDPKNIGKFDKEKVKQNIAYWDYKNGIYPQDALDKSLRELTETELIEKDARNTNNFDYIGTYLVNDDKLDGKAYQTRVKEEYEKAFYEKVVDEKGNVATAIKAEPAVQYIKDQYSIGGREQDFASINNKFQKQDPIKQQAYINKWGNDAQLAWWTLDDPNRTARLFPLVTETSQVKPSTPTSGGDVGSGKDKRIDLDLRETTTGSMASKPVPITGTIKYIDKKGEEKSYDAGLNDVRLTRIYYDNNRKEWMVDGILKRGTTEEDLDEGGVMSRTINEPITMTYDSVKEDVNREYNVLLPTVEKKKTTGVVGVKDTKL